MSWNPKQMSFGPGEIQLTVHWFCVEGNHFKFLPVKALIPAKLNQVRAYLAQNITKKTYVDYFFYIASQSEH